MAEMTHPDSKFSPFTLPLANGATLSGISYVPPASSTPAAHRPLMVLLHGASCNAHHYDVDKNHTASLAADAFSIPVVSINRPCYKETSSFYPLPEGSTFHKETGRWEHEFIFPILWERYGKPNGCTGLVALAHSLATPGLVIAAALYAQDPSPSYPLAGFIASSWGSRNSPRLKEIKRNANPEHRFTMSREQILERKHRMMLSEPHLNCADESVRQYMGIQTTFSTPQDELREHITGVLSNYFLEYSEKVNVPIMYGFAEHDWIWEGSIEHAREYESYFPNCPRFDGHLVTGAPHAIEWSHYAQGWYARCFGFALEVTAWRNVKYAAKSVKSAEIS